MSKINLSDLSINQEIKNDDLSTLKNKEMCDIKGGSSFLRGQIYSKSKQKKIYKGFQGKKVGGSKHTDSTSGTTLCDIVSKTYFCTLTK
jgi:hypothetical protein